MCYNDSRDVELYHISFIFVYIIHIYTCTHTKHKSYLHYLAFVCMYECIPHIKCFYPCEVNILLISLLLFFFYFHELFFFCGRKFEEFCVKKKSWRFTRFCLKFVDHNDKNFSLLKNSKIVKLGLKRAIFHTQNGAKSRTFHARVRQKYILLEWSPTVLKIVENEKIKI